MVSKLALKNFANWRWNTLEECINDVAGVLEPLSGVIDWQWFAAWQDRSHLDRFRHFLRTPSYFAELEFVAWYAKWLGEILRWVGTCRHGCARGVVCFFRGRLLRDAFPTAMQMLRDGYDEANAWEPSQWRGHLYLWQQSTAAVRFAFARGVECLSYLDKLPWLLARLDRPGIAKRAIDMFNAIPIHLHHPLSQEFLSPHHPSGLQMLVLEVDEDGCNVAPKLREAIQALQDIPLDDITGEGPHASAKRIIERASRGSFAWTAASCRLQQNLTTFETMCEASGHDAQTEWDRWSSVIKMKSRHCRSNRKPSDVAGWE